MTLTDDQTAVLLSWARLLDDDARDHYFRAVASELRAYQEGFPIDDGAVRRITGGVYRIIASGMTGVENKRRARRPVLR
jgi:hypothetical protein